MCCRARCVRALSGMAVNKAGAGNQDVVGSNLLFYTARVGLRH